MNISKVHDVSQLLKKSNKNKNKNSIGALSQHERPVDPRKQIVNKGTLSEQDYKITKWNDIFHGSYNCSDINMLLSSNTNFFHSNPIPPGYFKLFNADNVWILSLCTARTSSTRDAMDILILYLGIDSMTVTECDGHVIDYLKNYSSFPSVRSSSIVLRDIIVQSCIKGRSIILNYVKSVFPFAVKNIVTADMCAKGFIASLKRIICHNKLHSRIDASRKSINDLFGMMKQCSSINEYYSDYEFIQIAIEQESSVRELCIANHINHINQVQTNAIDTGTSYNLLLSHSKNLAEHISSVTDALDREMNLNDKLLGNMRDIRNLCMPPTIEEYMGDSERVGERVEERESDG